MFILIQYADFTAMRRNAICCLKIVVTLKPIPEYIVAAFVVPLSRSNKLILSVFSSSFGQIRSDVMASVG